MKPRSFSWDLYSGALLALLLFFQLMQWPLFPKFLDIYYHLSVMGGFDAAGGFVTTDFWEFAPSGRPHLYPPVLHVLMLFLRQARLGDIMIARLVDLCLYGVLVFVFWRVLRKVFSARVSFFALLLFGSSYSAYLASVTLAPFTLAFIFGLLAYSDLESGRRLRAALWLGLCFYTHTLGAFIFWAAFFIYAILRRGKWHDVLQVNLSALLIAAPFLWYQFSMRDYFHFVAVKENRLLELDIVTVFLGLAGVLVAWARRGPFLFPIALFIAEAALLGTHRYRFVSGHGILLFSWLAAFGIEVFMEALRSRKSQRTTTMIFLGIVFFFLFLSPVLTWNLTEGKSKLLFSERTVMRYLRPETERNFQAKGFSIYFAADYEKIKKFVLDHTHERDILWSDFSHGAGLVGLLTGRATSSAMLEEVKPFDARLDPRQRAKLLFWYKNPDAVNQEPLGMREWVKKEGLKKLGETDLAFFYENPKATDLRQEKKALIPTAGLWAIALFYAFAIVGAGLRTKKPNGPF